MIEAVGQPIPVACVTPGDLLVTFLAGLGVAVLAVALTWWVLSPSFALGDDAESESEGVGLDGWEDCAETVELPRGTGRHRPTARVSHAGQYRRGVDAPTAEVRSEVAR